MKTNFMRKLNVIFTGPYLKFWYATCVIIILTMLANWKINERVSKYEFTLYNTNGEVASKQIVDERQLSKAVAESPVTKSFKPVKW